MKALSIQEPWATRIAQGKKTIETRTWKTSYRGPILLCASKKPEGPLAGKAFALARIVDCRPMTKADEEAAYCEIYERANSWQLEGIINIVPYYQKGALSLFEVTLPEPMELVDLTRLSPEQQKTLQAVAEEMLKVKPGTGFTNRLYKDLIAKKPPQLGDIGAIK